MAHPWAAAIKARKTILYLARNRRNLPPGRPSDTDGRAGTRYFRNRQEATTLTFTRKRESGPLPNIPGRGGATAKRPRITRVSASIVATSLLALGLGAGRGWLGTVATAGAAVIAHNPAQVDIDFAKLVADIANSALEYNAFGDPSMPILRNAPLKFMTPVFHGSLVDANDVHLTTSQTGLDNTLVNLTVRGTYIGQRILENGSTVVHTDISLHNLNGTDALLNRDEYEPGTLTLGPATPLTAVG